VTLNTPALTLPTAPVNSNAGSTPIPGKLGFNPAFTIQTPAFNGTGIDSTTSSTTTTSITALNPTTISTTVNWTVVPVQLVPAPLPPLITHTGASTAPVTAQASIAISLVEEQPTSLTHFGQGLDFKAGRLFEEPVDARPRPTSWIDIIEPFQPAPPAEAPKGEPAPPPAPGQAQPIPILSPAAVDAVLELFDTSELTGSIDRTSQSTDNEKATWSPSALFGVAFAVVGGYRVAIHGSGRLSGRSLPRRVKARRWTW
jgi:hypothetical protein